jgi:2-dehydro-3-deoxygalactonokinase
LAGWAAADLSALRGHRLAPGLAGNAYAPCPAGEADLIAALKLLPTRLGPAWIVPGVNAETPNHVEVLRGEETKTLEALAAGWDGVVVSPGTHSKWLRLTGGRITAIRSFMTGELYAVLRAHSILGALMIPGPHDPDAFDLGVTRALADPAVTSLLLSVRAEGLFGRIAPTAAASFLSGILIGAEVRGGVAWCEAETPLRLIASPALEGLFVRALGLAGWDKVIVDDASTATAKGLWRIGRRLVR